MLSGRQVMLACGASVILVGVVFLLVPAPVYAHYVAITPRPLGVSVLADQRITGALLIVATLVSLYAMVKTSDARAAA